MSTIKELQSKLKKRKPVSPEKLFVITKYIKAKSALDAISKDKTTPVDCVYLEDNWKNKNGLTYAVGFVSNPTQDNNDE